MYEEIIAASKQPERGLFYLYTGNGKGKTTTALGVCVRAVGYGKKVIIIQFMKGRATGEYVALKTISPNLDIHLFGTPDFVDPKNPREIDLQLAQEGLNFAVKALAFKPDLILLDEANVAISFNLLKHEQVLEFVDKAIAQNTHVIVTGRYAKPELIDKADLVTFMNEVKHPLQKNIAAVQGLEF